MAIKGSEIAITTAQIPQEVALAQYDPNSYAGKHFKAAEEAKKGMRTFGKKLKKQTERLEKIIKGNATLKDIASTVSGSEGQGSKLQVIRYATPKVLERVPYLGKPLGGISEKILGRPPASRLMEIMAHSYENGVRQLDENINNPDTGFKVRISKLKDRKVELEGEYRKTEEILKEKQQEYETVSKEIADLEKQYPELTRNNQEQADSEARMRYSSATIEFKEAERHIERYERKKNRLVNEIVGTGNLIVSLTETCVAAETAKEQYEEGKEAIFYAIQGVGSQMQTLESLEIASKTVNATIDTLNTLVTLGAETNEKVTHAASQGAFQTMLYKPETLVSLKDSNEKTAALIAQSPELTYRTKKTLDEINEHSSDAYLTDKDNEV